MKKKVRKPRLTRGEKMLYSFSVMSLLATFVIQIFCGATLGNLTINNEKIKMKITSQQKTNESLNMQVNELTSFDYVKDVVKEMGLAYNNDNIVIVND